MFQVIATELYRNVLLAMLVVFLVTFLIIANPLTSLLVFLCVVFTVVSMKANIRIKIGKTRTSFSFRTYQNLFHALSAVLDSFELDENWGER
jgi:uncharacterized membrane protein YccC